MVPISLERIIQAVEEDDGGGVCIECGADASNVEPDARRYACLECGRPAVYGAEELLLMMVA